MIDWRDVAVRPDRRFEDALEAELIGRLFGRSAAGPDPTGRLTGSHHPGHLEDMMAIDLDEPVQATKPRARWVAAAAAALLAVGAGAVIVSQRGNDEGAAAKQDVTFTIQWPGLVSHPDNRCPDVTGDYGSATAGQCLRGWSGEAQFDGDIKGTAIFDMVANQGDDPGPGEVAAEPATFNATYLVSGTVAGCGSGEFMMAELLQFVGWDNGSFVGTWQVIPGSGRGDLATISGSGDLPRDLEAGWDESPRTHSGTIDCG